MADAPIIDQIMNQLARLNSAQQQEVLDYTIHLARIRGTPGKVLLERMKSIQCDPADLAEMQQAIEDEFEKVNLDGWDLPA
jgi:hypothetical protein